MALFYAQSIHILHLDTMFAAFHLFKKKLPFLFSFFLLGISDAFAIYPQQDSVTNFTLSDFYELVLANHPVARQALLLNETARQQLRYARGSFDPKITSDFNEKQFKGSNYFEYWDSQLKTPIWLGGADLSLGFERNTGALLNPENSTDSGNGLLYGGISLPIGRGLLIDSRRVVLRQAQIFEDIAEAERVKLLNKLFLEVAKDYFLWYFYHNQYLSLKNGYDLAKFRFQAVKINVEQGVEASIDSVEAKITLQEREINLQKAEVELQNARLLLSVHIWNTEGMPAELPEWAMPEQTPHQDLPLFPIDELLAFAEKNHPELVKNRLKLDQLDLERRLARENLKPVVNLKYNYLLQATQTNIPINDLPGFSNNYKLGVQVEVPLFMRKERAKLNLARIKIDQTQLEIDMMNREIMAQVRQLHNEFENLSVQLQLQEDMVSNYRIMVNGEVQKFFNGESSLFLVNVREGKLIDAEVKLFDMRQKYAKTLAELLWAAGMPPQ